MKSRFPHFRLGGPRAHRIFAFVAIAIHTALLGYSALLHSPVCDEVGHLPAGVAHWKYNAFELYQVNPPLVRMIAGIPLLGTDAADGVIPLVHDDARARTEFAIGGTFVKDNGADVFRLFTIARWACLPFSIIGAIVCWRWATELYGSYAGLLAVSLWCFCPNILGHAQLITPDVAAAALGVAAAYVFWLWLRSPGWGLAIGAGIVLGAAQLTKFTLVVLLLLWPVLWLAWRLCERRAKAHWLREVAHLSTMLIVAVYIINLGYGFEGSFRRLEDYVFVSRTLGGGDRILEFSEPPRNRFADTSIGWLPVPLPKNYVLGIDLQKWDFERGRLSYLCGEWKWGGWWYFYLYAFAIKVPLGTWLLVALTAALSLRYTTDWGNEIVLLAPIAVLLAVVSSETGFSHHLRYVLPIFPFGFIWVSKIARAVQLAHWKVGTIGSLALLWSVTSSLSVYPHSLSYFNELAGGPARGAANLLDSNIDWGQDLLCLRSWMKEHPEGSPLGIQYWGMFHPRDVGIPCEDVPRYAGGSTGRNGLSGPRPGWYALSVNSIYGYLPGGMHRDDSYTYFLQFKPVAMAGYSIYIYHITLDEANRVRREMGLEELGE